MRKLAGLLSVLLIAGCTLVVAGRFDFGHKAAKPRPAAPPAAAQNRAHHSEETSSAVILAFGTMYGVDGPFVGGVNPIRGVAGDELPWAIDGSIQGKLYTDGRLNIRVRGLVFKPEDPVPLELQGLNDETEFRGLVSCMTEVGPDVATENVITEGFPATPSGDSDIKATLLLPNPCVAPIVMVLGPGDEWFAVTGFEPSEAGSGSGDEDEDDD